MRALIAVAIQGTLLFLVGLQFKYNLLGRAVSFLVNMDLRATWIHHQAGKLSKYYARKAKYFELQGGRLSCFCGCCIMEFFLPSKVYWWLRSIEYREKITKTK